MNVYIHMYMYTIILLLNYVYKYNIMYGSRCCMLCLATTIYCVSVHIGTLPYSVCEWGCSDPHTLLYMVIAHPCRSD